MKSRFVTLSIFLLCLGALPAFADNLVVNGSFTSTSGTGWSTTQTNGNFPWQFSGGSGYASTGCVGPDCISGGSGDLADLNQVLSTVAGDTYSLSFVYSPQLDFDSVEYANELEVLFGGTVVADIVNLTDGAFVTYTFNGLVASSNTTELTFLGEQDVWFNYLTDVSVSTESTPSPVPEPSSLLLFGSGLLGMAGLTIRKALS